MTSSVGSSAPSAVTLARFVLNPATSTLTLCFDGPLDAQSAQWVAHYGVAINNIIHTAEAALLQCDNTVVLRLPAGSLTPACQVVAVWTDVLDTHGRPLQGRTALTVS